MRDRFEAAHLALAVAGRLMRHFDAIVRIRGCAVQDRRDQGTAGGLIARQRVGDQAARDGALCVQELAEESDRSSPIPSGLHEDVDHIPILVTRPPHVLRPALHPHEPLIEIPRISRAPPPPPSARILQPERPAPLADRLVRDGDAALGEEVLDVPNTEAELGDYQGDDDQWKAIPPKSVRVTKSSLKKLATEAGSPDIMPVWQHLSPLLADFVHGGKGQLTSNPISDEGWPQYPAVWFDTAMTAAVMSVLVTSGWFWAHIGDEERCDAIKALIASRDWAKVTTMRNGQEVRIVAR